MTELSPDTAEETLADLVDDAVPSRGYQKMHVVGLGGSAGSLGALQTFFASVPADSGMAYVVVVHLSPEHDSVLAELLQRHTRMHVLRVDAAVDVEADTVYVIPPGKMLRTMDGQLQLTELPARRHRHVTVDLFFRTLADTHGPHATAIVLSGADGDGGIGIKRIKERGGLTLAQDPDEAEHPSMPKTAIATGMVDWVLPVGQMAQRVVDYNRMEPQLQLPPEQGPQPARPVPAESSADEAGLRNVLAFLHTRTGHDFSYYKRATILRRLGRRMQVNGTDGLPGYLECLRNRPGEAGALLQDLLVSVTNFFRDSDCFAALEARIPQLFVNKGPGDTVRVWVAACATGEEAYSVAMLLTEHAATLAAPPQILVFGTDLDSDAIRAARDGSYPAAIRADVNDERLRRFFVADHHGWRVRRELREMVLFAVHDLLRDPPFSRLDLVTCRNLFIYLDRPAQGRAFDTFHFALQPQGLMFIGASESVDDTSHLFTVLDKKHRLYAPRAIPRLKLPVPRGASTLALVRSPDLAAVRPLPAVVPAGSVFDRAQPQLLQGGPPAAAGPDSWGELHLKLLEQLAPPSILVDAEHNIVHLSPGAGRFLHHAGGVPTRNLLGAVLPGLRIELRAALYQAVAEGGAMQPTTVPPLSVDLGAGPVPVYVRVVPAGDVAPGMLLVLLQAGTAFGPQQWQEAPPPRADADPVAQHLDRALERMKLQLRDTVEEYEASNEELKASNEELQAMNEELRSATEELETSREELQSINEELTTVNHELKGSIDQLADANGDLHNLMDATAIATVFLDRDLRIGRYTPPAVPLFNLIDSDVGRPLSDLTVQLDYPELAADAKQVLQRLVPVEREVSEPGGHCFLVRALLYRTLDDRIAGVVLTFVDISQRKRDQESLRQSEAGFAAIVNEATVGVVKTTPDGRILLANHAYCAMLGYAESELVGTPQLNHVHPDDRPLSQALLERLARDGGAEQIEKRGVKKDGSVVWLHNSMSTLLDAAGKVEAVLIVSADVSARREAEEALRSSAERLRLVIENAVDYAIFSTDLDRRVTSWSSGAERLLGYSETEIVGQRCDAIFTPEDCAAGVPARETAQALAEGRAPDDRVHQRKDGSRFWANGAMMPMHDRAGQVVGFVKIVRDQTSQRTAREVLEQSRGELLQALQDKEAALDALQAADASKDQFLAVLSHELRNPLAAIYNSSRTLELAQDRAVVARAAGIVKRQATAMKSLLDDLLDMSRLRLGRLLLHREPVPLAVVVDAAVEAVRPAIDAAQHRFTVTLPAAPVVLDADPVRLAQVLSNLVGNSAKYTPNGGQIALTVRLQAGEIEFTVVDNGIGMSPDSVESMFGMFSQSQNGERTTRGLGIGLALVRNIVELHGGRVDGTSEGEGRGSCFTVLLPLPSQDAAETDAAASGGAASQGSAPITPPDAVRGRILVADDNADAGWSLGALLEMSGFEVHVATGGHDALAQAAASRFDAAVLDIGMPDLSGHDVARRIRAQPWGQGLLLIAATGWGQDHDRQRASEAGFDAHLVKPVDVGELVELIVQRSHQGRRPKI